MHCQFKTELLELVLHPQPPAYRANHATPSSPCRNHSLIVVEFIGVDSIFALSSTGKETNYRLTAVVVSLLPSFSKVTVTC